jgi:hypothetical protein
MPADNPLDNIAIGVRELIEAGQAVYDSRGDYQKMSEEQQEAHDRLYFALQDTPAVLGPESVGYAAVLIRELLNRLPAGEVDEIVEKCRYLAERDPRVRSKPRTDSDDVLDILATKLDGRLQSFFERAAARAANA